jgi:Predicted membrane protein
VDKLIETKKSFTVRHMAVTGMLGAISVVLGMTPLGFIPVGPTNATIMHIPVIIGAIVEGPIVGMLVGLIFGIFSTYKKYYSHLHLFHLYFGTPLYLFFLEF